MEKIVWSNEYSTGISEIDSQHKMIIDMINSLIENINNPDKTLLNHKTIKALDKYSEDHFFAEEELLMKNNYPDLSSHQKLHAFFRKNTVNSAIKIMKGNEKVTEEMIDFLKKWWTNHILKMDMEYKIFFLSNDFKTK